MYLKKQKSRFALILVFSLFMSWTRSSNAQTSLKEIYKNDFKVGAALSARLLFGRTPGAANLVKQQYNTITAENVLKWEPFNPQPDSFRLEPADRYVAFGEANGMFIVGHNLVWHQQVPDWLFKNEDGSTVDRETLIDRMRDHIFKEAGRYKEKIDGWDVVNEAVNSDGSLRESSWLKIIGKDYLRMAFQFAHQAAPDAELYYNDYDLYKPAKREGVIRMVKNLQKQGVQIDGIGMQGHWGLNVPSLQQVQESIDAFSQLGVKVMITELDITILPRTKDMNAANLSTGYSMKHGLNPYKNELPDSMQTKLANRYAAIFRLFHKNRDKIDRVTFWGVNDGGSWLNNWPARGRTDYPLLFDRNNQPKPAFYKVVNVMKKVDLN